MLYEDLQLLTTPDLLHLPPVRWLMEPLIPEEGFVGLYGQPSGGKSFIALDWAMCISQGMPWVGEYPTKQAPVVYVAAEGGRGIQQRVRAWMYHHKKPELKGMYWLLNPLYVREEGTVEAFLGVLEEMEVWPGLIVLDTLSRSFGGGEENASADMGHFVDQITRLAQGRRMAALIVHHTNATGQRERGSTAFRGAADAMFGCYATKDKDTNRLLCIELKNDKQKDGVEAPSIWLRPIEGTPKSVVLEVTEAPAKKETVPKEHSPMRIRDMLSILAVAENGRLRRNEFRIACGLAKETFRRRLNLLLREGHISLTSEGWYELTPNNKDVPNVTHS